MRPYRWDVRTPMLRVPMLRVPMLRVPMLRVPMLRVAVALVVLAGLTAVPAPPAVAAVTSVNPSRAQVQPGEAARATVTVRGSGVNCLEVRVTPEDPRVAAAVSRACHDEATWTTGLTVHTAADAPPGTYSVEVRDSESGATFRLDVVAPPPPPTTTERPTTTTAPPTTTTEAPPTTTTEAPPTTTTEAPPTTEAPAEHTFAGLSALVDEGIEAEGLFLPLVDPSYRTCLPLTEPCAGSEGALVLVPARGAEVRWGDPPEDVPPPPALGGARVPALQPVGEAPPDARNRIYVLFVLDLADRSPGVAALARGLDDDGALRAPTGERPVVVPRVEGVPLAASAAGPAAPGGASLFAPPYRLSSAGLTEASPALAIFSGPMPQLLFGVRADPAWGLNQDFLPLLGNAGVAHLVRGPTGPAGLFVPMPAGLQAPPAPGAPAAPGQAEPAPRSSPLAVAGLSLAIGAVLGGLGLLVRRRWAGQR